MIKESAMLMSTLTEDIVKKIVANPALAGVDKWSISEVGQLLGNRKGVRYEVNEGREFLRFTINNVVYNKRIRLSI